jgi:hypothetical protein
VRALISHRTEAWTRAPDDPYLATHTMFGETPMMVEALRARGSQST